MEQYLHFLFSVVMMLCSFRLAIVEDPGLGSWTVFFLMGVVGNRVRDLREHIQFNIVYYYNIIGCDFLRYSFLFIYLLRGLDSINNNLRFYFENNL